MNLMTQRLEIHRQSRWLLNLSCVRLGTLLLVILLSLGCEKVAPKISDQSPTELKHQAGWFVDVSDSAQLTLVQQATGADRYFFPAIMGSGAAFVDFDLDRDLDIVLLDGQASEKSSTTNCHLYRQDEAGRFKDVTDGSGLVCPEFATGIAAGDVTNDGYPDLYVSCYGADHLFVNDRRGGFVDVTVSAGIANLRWGTSVAFGDYDRDGWLDIFVTNYVDNDPAQACLIHNGQQDFCNPAMFPRTADKLFRNVAGRDRSSTDGRMLEPADIRFEDVSLESGIALKTGAGLGVVCTDLNADHWPDFFVANDGHANFLWINQRDGTFREEGVLSGVAYDRLGKGQGSMGIALGDVNADQRLDLLVTNLDGENNALYLALPEGGFEESSASARISEVSFPRTGFGTALVDVDHDGDLDLLVANGRVRRDPKRPTTGLKPGSSEFWQAYFETNDLLMNRGDGVFAPYSASTDAFLGMHGAARALVTGDVDNDGDVDLLVTSVNGRTRLLHNTGSQLGHWLSIRAVLPSCGGRDALGARVTVVCGKRRWVSVVAPGTSYLSSHDPRLHFGLGSATSLDAIHVVWPDGREERFAGGDVDRLVVLEQGRGESP